jgi:DHA1 family tetracycline resistance protein-like MFS transporter
MGSLQSIGSLGVIITPLLGTAILAAVSDLPRDDWRMGSHFLLCAAMQAVAIVVAWRYFRTHRMHDSHGENRDKEEIRA